MTLHTDSRFDRLPKWAQQELTARGDRILQLQRELATARSLINTGPDDSEVVVDPYSENRRQIPDRPQIEFRFKPENDERGWWRYFLVRLRSDNQLEIHGSASIVVHPSSGNCVNVEVTGR